jgi:preprotein translocase subunit SecE
MGRLLKKKEPGLKKKIKSDQTSSAESESERPGENFSSQTAVIPNQQKITPIKKSIAGSAVWKVNNKYVDLSLQFLREVKVELKKVAWPSRKQAMGSTIVVIMLVLLVSFFLGIVDVSLSSLIKAVL